MPPFKNRTSHLRKYLPDRRLNQQVSKLVAGSGRLVDYDQLVSLKIVDQSCSRINGERGAADDEDIGILNIMHGGIQSLLVEPLLVQHDIRLYGAAALFTGGNSR